MLCLLLIFLLRVTEAYTNNHGLQISHCGQQSIYRIFNGEYTAIDEFPWTALLQYKDQNGNVTRFGCSGILITNRHVLTTAHCIKEVEKRGLEIHSVRLGEYDTSTEIDCVEMDEFKDCADPPQNILAANWSVHPDYNNHINDIALIKLKENAIITDFVRPICMPFANQTEEVGKMLIAAGWGRTENGTTSPIKLKVSVPIVTFSDCFEKYKTTNTFVDFLQHICAGSVLGKDACTGDSGGPLMTVRREDVRWVLIGIISTGNSCGLHGWPGIYIRVSHYTKWIYQQIVEL